MQLQRLGRHALSEKELGDAVEMMRRQARRMNRLIQDLLDVARIEAGALALQPAPVRVSEVLNEVVIAQRSIAGEATIDLRCHAPEDLPLVLADRDRLVQVLDNLVMNALKFTGPKGAIAISARHNGPEILFSVADSGTGISPEQASHLFNRFWQAKHGDRRGAGLGLAIVKGIVEAHGGRIWVESVVGQGTAFYFSVPIAKE
jgi:signal transduction histidine kinase